MSRTSSGVVQLAYSPVLARKPGSTSSEGSLNISYFHRRASEPNLIESRCGFMWLQRPATALRP